METVQPGANAPAAAEPVKTGDVVQTTAGVQQTTQTTQTPAAEENQIEAFKAKALDETAKRQRLEAEAQALKDQIAIMTSQQVQTQAQQTQAPRETLYDQVCKELGYDQEEYLTRKQQAEVFERINAIQNYNNSIAMSQQQFLAKHPDFAEVVGAVNPLTRVFMPSPHLQRLMTKDPETAQAIALSPNAAQLAYRFVTTDPEYLEEKKKASLTAEQLAAAAAAAAIKNTLKSGSISNIAGGSGMVGKSVSQMTDEEFKAHKEMLKARANLS